MSVAGMIIAEPAAISSQVQAYLFTIETIHAIGKVRISRLPFLMVRLSAEEYYLWVTSRST